MQAIVVKYLGPTDTKGARLKATCQGGSVTVAYPYHLTEELMFRLAAQQLQAKMNWLEYRLVPGALPNGDHVFVVTN